MAGIGALAASAVVLGRDLPDAAFEVSLAFVIVALVTAAGNMLNDYYDWEVDKVNHPERPIPSGMVRPKDALSFAIFFFVLSVFMALFINLWAFIVTILATLLLVSYESALKRRGVMGNITVSALVALVFFLGGAAAGTKIFEDKLIIVLGLLAFFSTLSREIIKDVEDVAGDEDRSTLPQVIGTEKALAAGSVALIIAIAMSPLPYFPLEVFGRPYMLTVIGADIIFCWAILTSRRDPHGAQSAIRYGMLVALFAFLNGAFFS